MLISVKEKLHNKNNIFKVIQIHLEITMKYLLLYLLIVVIIFIILPSYSLLFISVRPFSTPYWYEDVLAYKSNAKFQNNFVDFSRLNYSGECGEVFKYRPNNDRDYIIGSYDFNNEVPCIPKQMWDTLIMARTSMPHSHFVFIIYNFPKLNCHDLERLKKLHIEVVHAFHNQTEDASCTRFYDIENYINSNYNKIDRLVLVDITDTLFYGDFFATFNDEEIAFLSECFGTQITENCWGPYLKSDHYHQLFKYFGKQIANDISRTGFIEINAGFVFGGIEKIKRFVEVYNTYLDRKKMQWGYDQSLLNVLMYNGTFSNIGTKTISCEQRLCYIGREAFTLENKTIYFNGTRCSPVASYKFTAKNTVEWVVG
ncbi:hypothetical protein EIN_353160 [Entamoeba invadens IP1]|uniref:Uncharacterized protein n=1 Tax=Entamoeba invadens IP1 TaxID=370355 RepID=L7FM65_ENTIV|nr:hypothetical protein EIN_353160 [Entamoeba invadens IP1]ELP88536.1 hypothetical protein EIN_353160 [Entamoeba invadens IP1]|eukprot:XP_004255307.1 hypothetical protein EIN_353160 [Entamoeba invadens IP1]